MARDDRLKKAQDAGADFVEAARSKAEEFLRELSRAGGDTQGRAQVAIDELVESGRRGTELFAALIRKEIQNQLRALGLATKADLADLERRLGGRPGDPTAQKAPAQRAGTATTGPAEKAPAKKAAAKKAPPKKAAAKKSSPKPAG